MTTPAPSNLEEEMEKVVERLTEETSRHMLNMKLAPELTSKLVMNAEAEALSQLKQLIQEDKLKDFLDLIGRDLIIIDEDKEIATHKTGHNCEKGDLRQSARKRYSDG